MVRLRTIGECAIQVGASQVGPEAERLFATLLLLSTERGRRVSRTRLIDMIWPGVEVRNGRHCLRQTVYKLRQLGAPVEVSGGYLELPGDAVEGGLDALVTASEFDPDDVPLDATFAEWLPGYAPTFSRPLQEWVEKQRDYVHAQVRRAMVRAMIERRAQNRWADVDALARRCLALDPLNEEATLALAEAAAMTGSKTTALRILDAYLAELGPTASDIGMPAEVLRKRIAERLKQPRYVDPSEAFFVGRAAVMAGFAADLQSARGGYGSAHLAWGPSGIGKSRLTVEVAKLAALQGFRVQRATCQSTDANRPLSIFADVVPALRKLPGAAGVDPKSVKYLKRLSEYDDELADPPDDAYDAAVRFANVRRSIFDLFDAVTTECALLFVVDDAHWLDPMSWGVLREIMEGARSHRLLVLCTSRSPHLTAAPPVEATRGLRVQRLEPLDGASCAELVDAVTLGSTRGAPDARLLEWTLTVAEGNPLFVRALIGHWLNGYPEYTLPPSLEALIEERLDRLTPEALRVLQACAVLGKHATVERVRRTLDTPTVDLLTALGQLEETGLLTVTGRCVTPKHDVIRKHALGRSGAAATLVWHHRIGVILREIASEERCAQLAADAAEHLILSGEEAEAEEGVLQFAHYLASLGLIDDGVQVLELSRERFRSIQSRSHVESAIDGLLARGWKWFELHRRSVEKSELCDEDRGKQPNVTSELLCLQAQWRCGDDPESIVPRIAAICSDFTLPPRDRLEAAFMLLAIADNTCNRQLGIRTYASVSRLLSYQSADPALTARISLVYHTVFGELETVPRFANALLDSVKSAEIVVRTDAMRFAGYALSIAGRTDEACSLLAECLDLLKIHSVRPQQLPCLALLADLACDRADYFATTAYFNEAWRVATELSDELLLARVRRTGAILFARQRDRAKVAELWDPTHSEAHHVPVVRDRALAMSIWLFLRNTAEAPVVTETLNAAQALFDSVQAFGGQDFFCDELANALIKAGRTEQAQQLVQSYRTAYRRECAPHESEIQKALSITESAS